MSVFLVYFLLFFFKPNLSLWRNLNITIAEAINTIATASYTKPEGSISFPCKIMNRDKAVMAINKGRVMLIVCWSQKILTIANTSKYRNINNKSAKVTDLLLNIVPISKPTAIIVLTSIMTNKRS